MHCSQLQAQRKCFDVYVVHMESETGNEGSGLTESDWVIPSVNENGLVTLNMTTNSTLSANTFYRATLITTMDMMEIGSVLFCKCTST